ncbi:MAG: SRPBCC family protein [Methylococcaceae bacterium]|nr:SRPBCC family protein [Methylococcaceae bacterium]
MFKIVAIVFVVLFAGLLIHVSTRPDTFHVQREASIKAPPENIFWLINDLHGWLAWSPYEKKDPGMQRAFSGTVSGKGAVYGWDGNKAIGKGTMEITDSSPPSKITLKLDFVKPFECHNIVEFALQPQGDATHVTWAIHGPSPYLSKLMGFFINMDDMIGKDFEEGLADLKALAEKQAAGTMTSPARQLEDFSILRSS